MKKTFEDYIFEGTISDCGNYLIWGNPIFQDHYMVDEEKKEKEKPSIVSKLFEEKVKQLQNGN